MERTRLAAPLLLAALLLASPSRAAHPPTAMLGPIRPDAAVATTMRETPQFHWRPILSRTGGVLVGAVSDGPLQFAGLAWTIGIGDRFGFDPGAAGAAYDYEVDMRADVQDTSRRDCLKLLSRVVEALEPMYGPFGHHPAFPHESPLYGGGEFRIRSVGEASVARDNLDTYLTDFVTFAEIDESAGDSAMAKASFFSEGKACELRINVFRSPERAERARAARASFEPMPK